MKTLYIDFEYFNSNENKLHLVCATTSSTGGTVDWWLDGVDHEDLRRYISKFEEIVCYSASAEARSFIALGLDPMNFKWIDLYLEYAQLRNNNPLYQYGKMKVKGKIIKTTPSTRADDDGWRLEEDEVEEINAGGNHAPLNGGLATACLNLLDVDIDTEHKNAMRDLILRKPYQPFNDGEVKAIMDYCHSDVKYLYELHKILNFRNGNPAASDQYLRGRFGMYMAICENKGIPINPERFFSLSLNHKQIVNTLIEECNAAYPFYVKAGKWRDVMESKGTYDWVRKKGVFDAYIKSTGVKWELTPSGAYSTEDKVLANHLDLPPIVALKECKKQIQQISWFRGEGLDNMMERVGSDMRMRPWFNPYGTQTSRNAPPAKQFVFAMSSWLRCLIDPQEGYAITGMDWASQEYILAAVLAKDLNMIESYNSGDPYLWMAKKGGLCPEDATKEHPARDLIKSVVLGIQFGMGIKGIARKLTTEFKKEFTECQAEKLVNVHKRAFPKFWNRNEYVAEKYLNTFPGSKALILTDGWAIFRANNTQGKSINSLKNFPIQGTGAVIMRQAVHHAMKDGLDIMCPLHDALYVLHKIEDMEEAKTRLQAAMDKAVKEIFTRLGMPDVKIRVDAKTFKHGDYWVEKKGKDVFEKMKGYLTHPDWMTEYLSR